MWSNSGSLIITKFDWEIVGFFSRKKSTWFFIRKNSDITHDIFTKQPISGTDGFEILIDHLPHLFCAAICSIYNGSDAENEKLHFMEMPVWMCARMQSL